MDKIHDSVAWYQKKIGSYDKQLWEHSVDSRLLKGIQSAPRRSVKVKTELIDVDLVRGSTFSKVKPQVSWTYITHKAITRVLFFPLFYRWWMQQTSFKFWLCLLVLYILQVTAIIIFFRNIEYSVSQDELCISELVIPIVLMLVLGMVHSQTVLSHFSHRAPYRDGKFGRNSNMRRSKSWRSYSFTRSTSMTSADNEGTEVNTESPSSGRSNPKGANRSEDLNKQKLDKLANKNSKWSPINSTRNKKEKEYHVRLNSDVPLDHRSGHSKQGHVVEGKSVSWSDVYSKTNSGEKGLDALESCSLPVDKATEKGAIDSTVDSDINITLATESKFVLTGVHLQSKKPLTPNFPTGKYNRGSTSLESDIEDENNGMGNKKLNNDKANNKNDRHSENQTDTDSKTDSSNGRFEILSMDRISQENKPQSEMNKCESKNLDVCQSGKKRENGFVLHGDVSSHKDILELPSVEKKSGAQPTSNHISKQIDIENDKNVQENDVQSGVINSSDTVENKLAESKIHKNSSFSDFCHDMSDLDIMGECGTTSLDSSAGLNIIHKRGHKSKKETESDSDRAESDSESKMFQGLRRRKPRIDDSSESGVSYIRARRTPSGLISRGKETKNGRKMSSSEGEVNQLLGDENKGAVSSEEWEDRVHSEVSTSTYSSTSSCGSDGELSENEQDPSTTEQSKPGSLTSQTSYDRLPSNNIHPTSCTGVSHHAPPPDKVSCLIWESSECKKVELTAMDIGWTIIEKVDNIPESSDYILIGLAFSVFLGFVPIIFRAYHAKELPSFTNLDVFLKIWRLLLSNSWRINLVMLNGIIQRMCLSSILFFMLSVADRTFKQRLLYAKHFCYLTSSRRARKFDMPHFRLNKVRNIKTWLSLRSYLKKRGPQRSVDVIVSASFLILIILLTLMCLQLLKDTDTYLDLLCNWELLFWSMTLGVYLMRFMTLGLKINKKYRNLSVLITEQINLYLQMEQKPHKKEELMVANNVLKLAEDLLKELESPFKISGVTANPVIYNVIKVVVLSAFSAVLTELLGFKLKLYKIKLRA